MDNREETLLHRVLERRAAPNDWDRLCALADADAGVWRRLAETLRADDLLAAAVSEAVEPGGVMNGLSVVLPVPDDGAEAGKGAGRWTDGRLIPLLSGWAAALVLAALWWAQAAWPSTADPAPAEQLVGVPSTALTDGPVIPAEARAALAGPTRHAGGPVLLGEPGSVGLPAITAAFDAGPGDPFVSELPAELVEARPTADGRVEVLYVRRELHSAVVDRVWSMARDDAGRPTPVRSSSTPTTTTEIF